MVRVEPAPAEASGAEIPEGGDENDEGKAELEWLGLDPDWRGSRR